MRRLADGAGAFCCGRSASKLIGKTAPEHREDGRLFRLQTRKCITQLILYHGLDLEQQIAVHVRAEHLRMHIAFSANGRGITQTRGDSFDRGSQISFDLRRAVETRHFAERHGCQYRSGPCPEIFRGDVFAGDLLQIGVYIAGCNVLRIPLFVYVLKQLLAGQLLACPDDLCDTAVLHSQGPFLAALPNEAETHLVPIDRNVAVFKGG